MSVPALGVIGSAVITGGLRFVELASFELLGRAAPQSPWPPAAGFLAAAALAHAWRAGQLGELLPVSVGLPSAEECTASPGAAADEAFLLLDRLSAEAPGAFLHAVVETLYPALASAYASRAQSLVAASDAALGRTLRRVRADLEEVRRDGVAVLRSTGLEVIATDEPDAARRAGSADGGQALSSQLAELLEPCRAPFGVPAAGAAS